MAPKNHLTVGKKAQQAQLALDITRLTPHIERVAVAPPRRNGRAHSWAAVVESLFSDIYMLSHRDEFFYVFEVRIITLEQ